MQVKPNRIYSQIFTKNPSWYKNLNFAANELRLKSNFLTFSFFVVVLGGEERRGVGGKVGQNFVGPPGK